MWKEYEFDIYVKRHNEIKNVVIEKIKHKMTRKES